MNLKNWIQTMFSVYGCLENLIETIDKYVEMKTLSSMYSNLMNLGKNCTLKVFDDVTKLINKKIVLLNLKFVSEKVLENLPSSLARFIILKYIEERRLDEIAEIMEKSTRTVARYNAEAISRARKILSRYGYDENKFFNMCHTEKWLLEICKSPNLPSIRNAPSTLNIHIKIMANATREYRQLV